MISRAIKETIRLGSVASARNRWEVCNAQAQRCNRLMAAICGKINPFDPDDSERELALLYKQTRAEYIEWKKEAKRLEWSLRFENTLD